LRLGAIAGRVAPFNSEFRFSGGSDSFLFQSLRSEGKRIVWEPNALVYEFVPRSRICMRWLVARSFRQGITLARCDRLINSSPRRLALRAARGFVQFPLGLAECILSLARKDQNWRRGITRIARGAGVFAGLSGASYDEYRREQC
jgi:succinoglycan biosynthesis protein ExoM